jgi:tRNA(Ile)-lysidine synthase
LNPLEKKLESLIDNETKNYFVAYSGGVDSTVLLNCVNETLKLVDGASLIALHINHNYSGKSSNWKKHCIDFCNKRDINLLTYDLDISLIRGASLENQLRELRYKIFEETLNAGGKIFLGHHLDDNVETLFLRLFRGTGLKGAKSIPFRRSLGKGELLRPFLNVAKKDIEAYAQEKELNFINDDSNEDISFDRNFIRKEILPLVEKRWPKYNYNLSKFILNANESYEIVLSQTKKDFNFVSSDKKNKIVLSKLIGFPKNKQKNIIIYWIDSLGLNIPNTKILNEIVEKFVFALKDKNPKFIWGTSEKEGSVCLKIKKDFLIAQSIT